MRYLSIDVETTGLEPERGDQILQIAVILDDLEARQPVIKLPTWTTYIRRARLSGSPVALSMNQAHLLRTTEPDALELPDAQASLLAWLDEHHISFGAKTIAAGKNFASFDRRFLRIEFPKFEAMLHHRSLDPAMLFWRAGDNVLPSLVECCKRAYLSDRNITWHDAVDDARMVVWLIRHATKSWKESS
jgi:oligoribonuclease (3'-5' exoribonuclease)